VQNLFWNSGPPFEQTMDIPTEGFELLLDVIELVGYDDHTINFLNKNLPASYDLSKFPPELLNSMLKIATTHTIISGRYDSNIKIQNSEMNENKNMCHNNAVLSVCVLSRNQQIVSASADHNIKIWNKNAELICTLTGHTDYVHSVCNSPDDRYIVSGSYDTYIKIWDAESGALIRTLVGHTGLVLVCVIRQTINTLHLVVMIVVLKFGPRIMVN
jgi:WD40 repeat protein